jgi:hypothetical protein
MIVTAMFVSMHMYHAVAEDLDTPTSLQDIAKSLAVGLFLDTAVPGFMRLAMILPYFLLLLLILAIVSETMVSDIIGPVVTDKK